LAGRFAANGIRDGASFETSQKNVAFKSIEDAREVSAIVGDRTVAALWP
jgi:hypothetical protein